MPAPIFFGAAATVAGTAAKAGILSKIWIAIKTAFASIKTFLAGKSAAIGLGVTAATSMLSGSSFETKNKKVTFGKAGTFGSSQKGYYTLPTVQVRDKKYYVPYGESYGNYTSNGKRVDSYAPPSGGSSKNDWNRPSYPRR